MESESHADLVMKDEGPDQPQDQLHVGVDNISRACRSCGKDQYTIWLTLTSRVRCAWYQLVHAACTDGYANVYYKHSYIDSTTVLSDIGLAGY